MSAGEFSVRQLSILTIVERRGFVSISDLVAMFDVTPQTIRRDANILATHKLIERVHGGICARTRQNDPHEARMRSFSKAKERIAQAVADHFEDGASLFINIGTTTEAVASALLAKRDLRIVTNSLNVGQILSANESFHIIIAGGELRHRDSGMVGGVTSEILSGFRMQYAVIGVSGITKDGSLLDYDPRETSSAKQIIEHASESTLIAD